MKTVLRPHYSTVTEQPLERATRSQLAMLYTRYAWAAGRAAGKDVLEVACGTGLGLGWLARTARRVEAGDLDEINCRVAEETFAADPKVRVRRMDAERLPFDDQSFDLALLFEALYYVRDFEAFVGEARRVLRPGGELLITTANREWSGFNPSPFSTKYYSAAELEEALEFSGFEARLWAGFPDNGDGLAAAVGLIRRAAIGLDLVPRTMRGKQWLKRLFYGPLEAIPRRLEPDGIAPAPLTPLDGRLDLTPYRVLYAQARRTLY